MRANGCWVEGGLIRFSEVGRTGYRSRYRYLGDDRALVTALSYERKGEMLD